MIRRLALVATLAVAAAPAFAGDHACAPTPSARHATLKLDFLGAATLDRRLVPSFGLHGGVDKELQVYVPDEVTLVPNVGLRLRTERHVAQGHEFSSGQVTTRGTFAQQYGHFEILARMPQANGIWPAFWLAPENDVWPPEIDIVEYIYAPSGNRPDAAANRFPIPTTTLHWRGADGSFKQIAPGFGDDTPSFRASEDWNATPPLAGTPSGLSGYHRYAVDWRPGQIAWQVDGKPAFCVHDDAADHRVPDMPLYLILNQAVSAGSAVKHDWTGFIEPNQRFPLDFDIASVEVDQFDDLSPPPPPLAIRDVGASVAIAHPGDTVTLHARLDVGGTDLGATTSGTAIGLRGFDPAHYTGAGSYVVYVPQQLPDLAPGRTYPVTTQVTIPLNLAPGYYSVSVEATYQNGPLSSPGGKRFASVPQGAVIEVTSR